MTDPIPSDDRPSSASEFSTEHRLLATERARSVIVCSRVRLARNLADFPFLPACSVNQSDEIKTIITQAWEGSSLRGALDICDPEQLDVRDWEMLVQLEPVIDRVGVGAVPDDRQPPVTSTSVSREAPSPLANGGSAALTINEEDHLRIQVTSPGFDLSSAWQAANAIDDTFEQVLNFAFHPQWGYLTASPANVGTGMRASIILHLPALVMTMQFERHLRRLSRINMVGRELNGEMAGGDFFRISNQATLGFSESELIAQVSDAIPTLVNAELTARDWLLQDDPEELQLDVDFAYEELTTFDLSDPSKSNRYEIARLLSSIRLGIAMGLFSRSQIARVRQMFELAKLRRQLDAAVASEKYQTASQLRDRIQILEGRDDAH